MALTLAPMLPLLERLDDRGPERAEVTRRIAPDQARSFLCHDVASDGEDRIALAAAFGRAEQVVEVGVVVPVAETPAHLEPAPGRARYRP